MYNRQLEGKAGKSLWTHLLNRKLTHLPNPSLNICLVWLMCQFSLMDYVQADMEIINSSGEWHYVAEREQEGLRSRVPSSNPIPFAVNWLCDLEQSSSLSGLPLLCR